jgi:hypothetical protein
MHYTNVHVTSGKGIALDGALPQLVHSSRNPVAQQPDQLSILRNLEAEYLGELEAEDYDRYARLPYGLESSPQGRFLTVGDRRLYRDQVLAAERSGRRAPLVDEISLSVPRRAVFALSRERPAIRVAARELRTEIKDVRRGMRRRREVRTETDPDGGAMSSSFAPLAEQVRRLHKAIRGVATSRGLRRRRS